MPEPDSRPETPLASRRNAYRLLLPELERLCALHGLERALVEGDGELTGLLERVRVESESCLTLLLEQPPDSSAGRRDAARLRALIAFSAQATALQLQSAVAAVERHRVEATLRLHRDLERAVAECERADRCVDDLLAAFDAGVIVLGPGADVRHVNRAARRLVEDVSLVPGADASHLLVGIAPGGDGELQVPPGSRGHRVLAVARRALPGEPGAEVLLLDERRDDVATTSGRAQSGPAEATLDRVGMICHKINNPLTALLGRAQILRMKPTTDPHVKKAAAVIEESARRIADDVRELAGVIKSERERKHEGP